MKPAALEAPRLSSALGRGMGLVFKQQEADLKTTETKKKHTTIMFLINGRFTVQPHQNLMDTPEKFKVGQTHRGSAGWSRTDRSALVYICSFEVCSVIR